jgi:hypothetical protein
MIDSLLNWIGSHWGRQHDAIVCENCDWEDPTDTYAGNVCPECGTHGCLAIAVDNGLLWEIRYLSWKADQRWWPQRYYQLGTDDSEDSQFVMWWGRKWRVRPWEGLL